MIRFVVNNAYVVHGGVVFEQVCCVPMGTSSGPKMTHYYCQEYEYAFLSKMVAEGNEDACEAMAYSARGVDDIHVPYNNKFHIERFRYLNEGGIYPGSDDPDDDLLTLNIESTRPDAVHFWDIISVSKTGRFSVSVLDKYDLKVYEPIKDLCDDCDSKVRSIHTIVSLH